MSKLGASSLVVFLLIGHPVLACTTLEGKGAVSPLKTRKPVLDNEVRLLTGFGMRRDPVQRSLKMHAGVGWGAARGSPVLAANGGLVLAAGVLDQFGNAVIIDHGSGWQTLYGHLDTFVVRAGDCVEALAIIGSVGSTGLATGPRLYFEVRRNGQPIDPLSVLVEGNP